MPVRLHRLLATVTALLLCLTLSFSQLSLADVQASIVCCCGEHPADQACGCPDCPVADGNQEQQADHDEEENRDRGPSVSPCSGRTEVGYSAPTTDLLLPQMPSPPTLVVVPGSVHAPSSTAPARTLSPPALPS